MSERVKEFMKGVKKLDKSFEDQWFSKFSKALDETVGKDVRGKIMQGSERPSVSIDQEGVVEWTIKAMDRLDKLADERSRRKIMTGCACRFPEHRLQPLRERFEKTEDFDSIHRMLQNLFVSDLKTGLKLNDDVIRKILSWGWGVAGVRQGTTIIATKMPFELKEHLDEKDPQMKRYHYCHCPRVRAIIRSPKRKISTTYCYCGAGFYKHIWENILQRPVEVEVLETVLGGANVCRIAIHLPPNTARP